MSARKKILLIGYGNTLRGDDGVGPRAAELVAQLNLPGLATLICHQLSPEHADPVSQADVVIFVDAAVDSSGEVQLHKLEPKKSDSSQLMAHTADPRTVLALSRDVFERMPEAWLLTIPVIQMEFSERLSLKAQRGLKEAVEKVQALCDTISSGNEINETCRNKNLRAVG